MSKRQEIYREYLARWQREHPGTVQPARVPLSDLDGVARRPFGHQAKFHTSGPCSVYKASDGRVIEVASTTSGLPAREAAVFASEREFFAYRRPADFTSFHEAW